VLAVSDRFPSCPIPIRHGDRRGRSRLLGPVPQTDRSAGMAAAVGIDQDLVDYLRATRWPCGLQAPARGTTNDNNNSRLSALFGRTKINSSDPHVMSVWTPYPAAPLLALFTR
jgi:hypothetical protein